MGNHTTEQLNDAASKYVAKEKVLDAIAIQNKMKVNTNLLFMEGDAFTGNPYSVLGRVLLVRGKDEKCPEGDLGRKGKVELAALPIGGIEIDENSKIKQPQKRGSAIVTKEISANVGFLNYLSGELSSKSVFSIMVFDQVTGLIAVQKPSWKKGLEDWIGYNAYLLQDPNVCYIYVIAGFVQKNVIRKRYTKLDTKIKGGAYGINIGGELHTSNEDYFLDIRFGLTPVLIKSPTFKIELPKNKLLPKMQVTPEVKNSTSSLIEHTLKNKSRNFSLPNLNELNVFNSIKTTPGLNANFML